MAQAGILEWSNSIRFNMATDPGRQLFQDQINTYGFLFLDDYLDNILSGAKQDPLIELVKTPGRKKAVSMKPKPTSKLSIVTSSLQDEENDKENITPINNFHKVLLEAKEKALYKPPPPAPFQCNTNNMQRTVPLGFDTGSMPPAVNSVPSSNDLSKTLPNEQADDILNHIDQNELSAIAEDDENVEQSDRSHVSFQVSRHGNDAQPRVPLKENVSTSGRTDVSSIFPKASVQEEPQAMNVTTSSDTFHSIALDSPPAQQPSNAPSRSPSPLPIPVVESKPSESLEGKYEQSVENHMAPLPPWNPPIHVDITSVPAPSVTPATTSSSLVQAVGAAPLPDESSPKGIDQNSGVSLYPALPAPMPLRKSMRAPRDPSVGSAPLSTTTPGAPLGGKRTSWLKKAREVKALEGTTRNLATLGLPAGISQPHMPFLTNPLKRKSGDLTTIPAATGLEDEERHYKNAKNADGDVAPLQPQISQPAKGKEKKEKQQVPVQFSQDQALHGEHEGMLDRLKKTVEGLGARVGKSMGKSLGAGAAGSALAEARAAAEARVAERNNKDEELTRIVAVLPTPETIPQSIKTPLASIDERKTTSPSVLLASSTQEAERRLSISDLFSPNDSVAKIKSKASEKIFQITPPVNQIILGNQSNRHRESGTTTPPDSPPATRPTSFTLPSGPVFNKPPPVFIPPAPASKPVPPATQDFKVSPSATTVSDPGTVQPAPLTAQSTMESVKSDGLFDHDDDDDDDVPAWMPTTQDTEYFGSQDGVGHTNVLDEDDSWPLDEKLAPGAPWTFGGGMSKEDSITWSTAPSQSQRLDTVHSHKDQTSSTRHDNELQTNKVIPGAFDIDMDTEEQEVSVMITGNDVDLEEMVMEGASTVSLVEPAAPRSQSQASMASSASSQSQAGFFGQASKLLNSALGTSKKGKPEVKKVLQMAAVAAKKQQEENDKKTARLKDMENRRQQAIQRKAEEEKARIQEEERKLKEEGERRKREREENTEKRPLKIAPGKKDEEPTKKRKVTVEVEKKPELKKPASKTALKSTTKQQTTLHSSAAYNSSFQPTTNINATSIPKTSEAKSKPLITAVQKGKGKGKAPSSNAPIVEDEVTQPSQVVQAQMTARAKAQMQAAKQATVQSESIELPDINSEYSDSDDEDRVKTFDPPHWAQSPELRQALHVQSTINPDDVFGSVRPLKMEELFKTRTSRFRARTSSANWTGADRLTLEEEREYARKMGFK